MTLYILHLAILFKQRSDCSQPGGHYCQPPLFEYKLLEPSEVPGAPTSPSQLRSLGCIPVSVEAEYPRDRTVIPL
jgi:hypothetical protein